VPDLVGIDGDSRRCLQACGLNFAQPGGVSVSEKGKETEEGMGLYRRGFPWRRG
jgi:hypothetical protein